MGNNTVKAFAQLCQIRTTNNTLHTIDLPPSVGAKSHSCCVIHVFVTIVLNKTPVNNSSDGEDWSCIIGGTGVLYYKTQHVIVVDEYTGVYK